MADWLCPRCGGGFPDSETVQSAELHDTPSDTVDTAEACPWCGYRIAPEDAHGSEFRGP